MKLIRRCFSLIICILLISMAVIVTVNFIRDARILQEPIGNIWSEAFGRKP